MTLCTAVGVWLVVAVTIIVLILLGTVVRPGHAGLFLVDLVPGPMVNMAHFCLCSWAHIVPSLRFLGRSDMLAMVTCPRPRNLVVVVVTPMVLLFCDRYDLMSSPFGYGFALWGCVDDECDNCGRLR